MCLQSHFQQRLDRLTKLHSAVPPDGHSWDCPDETLVLVSMPDGQAISVPVKQDFLVADLLCSACKVTPASNITYQPQETSEGPSAASESALF